MPIKPHHGIIGIITTGEASPYAWELPLADRLQTEFEVVLIESQELTNQAHLLKDGLYVVRSTLDSVVRRLTEIGANVILTCDIIDRSFPDHWIILPLNSSPINVAKIAKLFLYHQTLSERQFIPDMKIESATYAHSHSIWDNVQRFSSSLDDLSTFSERLRAGAQLLSDSLCGARVVRIGLQNEDGEYSLLKTDSHLSTSIEVSRNFITRLESGNLVFDASADDEIRMHLKRHNAKLIVSVRGKTSLLGWFLVAVDDYHQVFLNKPLAEKIAKHLGAVIDGREQITDLMSFKHAVHEGLDQLEIGVSILNKDGFPLVENAAARDASQKLGCSSAHLIPEMRAAIQKAKFGCPSDIILNNYAVHTSPWGNLNNGCVLQTRSRAADENNHLTTLDAWLKELHTTAKSLGMEFILAGGNVPDLMLVIPDGLSIESVCRFLSTGDVKPKMAVGYEATTRVVRFNFDQEYLEGFTSRPDIIQKPPPDIEVLYASLGRRVAIVLPLTDSKTSHTLTATM